MTVAMIVEKMSEFSRNTKNDTLSVTVSRIAHRLEHAGDKFEKSLTPWEIRIINTFVRSV